MELLRTVVLLIGAFVLGAFTGMLIMGMCVAAGRADDTRATDTAKDRT